MDLGDWQEFSRLRAENHSWHRCVTEILAALDKPAATTEFIVEAIRSSVGTLNETLRRLHRHPVVPQ